MSAQACLIGFGPFNKSLAKYMDYPEDWYNDVKEGTDVIVSFFHCNTTNTSMDYPEDWYNDVKEGTDVIVSFFHRNTTNTSRELAEIFNSNLTDFNTHKIIDLKKYDIDLKEILLLGIGKEEWKKDIIRFKKCIEAGFVFFFQPNC